MNQSVTTKTFEEKVSSVLHEAKAQLGSFEAQAKSKKAQAEADAVKILKAKHQQIETKRRELQKAGDAKAAQLRADLESDIAQLKAGLSDLSTRFKNVVKAK